ncbi:MAG TPA: M24 family metallopeptidase [Candidatus Hydrogenedentes bacterium]|nr:M24 family metallopeptidase [Candidatus Hydrogenedentota bacterium]HPG68967.1 M24 family metallopeptidase [Candidatus Hydrogenedentota bacterium]
MNEVDLFRIRIALVQAFLESNGYDGILLSRVDNYAMATGGKRGYIWVATDMGANALFVTKDGKAFFVGNTIEFPRQMDEELATLGCDVIKFLWFEDTPAEAVKRSFSGRLVSDDGSLGPNVNAALANLRAMLTPLEFEKYRRLGRRAADAMTATLEAIAPGIPEADIAARLVAEGAKRRCLVPVALVAADGRIARYRHPLPTEAPLVSGSLAENGVKGYVMVVGCFMKEGLVASMTRFKCVGDLPAHVPDAYNRICAVDAIMQEATEAGRSLGDVFAACQQAYADYGFAPNEWHNHHQGGATGYAGRTCKGAPGETFPVVDRSLAKRASELAQLDVQIGAAFAWNPSAVGVKSEDTFLLLPDGTKEIVTGTPQLPQVNLAAILGRETSVVKSAIA